MPDVLYQIGWNQLLAIAMALVVWLICRTPWLARRPAFCHGLWLLVLLKVVTPPIVPLPVLPAGAAETSPVNNVANNSVLCADCSSTSTSVAGDNTRPISGQSVPTTTNPFATQSAASLAVGCETLLLPTDSNSPASASTTPPSPRAVTPTIAPSVPWSKVLIALLSASIVVTCLIVIVAARRHYQTARLLAFPPVETGRAARLLHDVSRLFQLRTIVMLRIVDAPVTPMLWAVPGRPTIVLPQELIESLDDDGLRNIIAHELAHYIRRDHWVNLFTFAAAGLLWWHPIVWLTRRQIAATAEASCDALALDRLPGSRKSYARTLLNVVDSLKATPPRAALAITFGQSASLKRRFQMIADGNVKPRMTSGSWALLALGLAPLALVPARAEVALAKDKSAPSVETSKIQEDVANTKSPAFVGPFCCPPEADKNKTSTDSNPDANAADDDWTQEEILEAVYPSETSQQLSAAYRYRAENYQVKHLALIGDLVKGDRWKNELPLADAQEKAISKLDDVVVSARAKSLLGDAQYLEGSPANYVEYAARQDRRRWETIKHAQRMVELGLLTRRQADFVLQRWIVAKGPFYAQEYERVQELLGMTESQIAKVGDVRTDAGALRLLTPAQRKTWTQLTAKRTLPAKPPEFPAPSKAAAARINLEELSAVFRALSRKGEDLALTEEQKKRIKSLKEVARQGVFWISQRRTKPPLSAEIGKDEQSETIFETRTKFLYHAGNLATSGILTQRQAEQVWEIIVDWGC